MTAHLFAQNDRSRYERANLPVDGGRMNIPGNILYIPLCYDYYGNEYIYFRNENSLDLFEAYSAPACTILTGRTAHQSGRQPPCLSTVFA